MHRLGIPHTILCLLPSFLTDLWMAASCQLCSCIIFNLFNASEKKHRKALSKYMSFQAKQCNFEVLELYCFKYCHLVLLLVLEAVSLVHTVTNVQYFRFASLLLSSALIQCPLSCTRRQSDTAFECEEYWLLTPCCLIWWNRLKPVYKKLDYLLISMLMDLIIPVTEGIGFMCDVGLARDSLPLLAIVKLV